MLILKFSGTKLGVFFIVSTKKIGHFRVIQKMPEPDFQTRFSAFF